MQGRMLERAVMVRVKGQDTLGFSSLGRPFFTNEDGQAVISASGIIFDARRGVVLTTKTLLTPFMEKETLRPDDDSPQCCVPPRLRQGTTIEVLLDDSLEGSIEFTGKHRYSKPRSASRPLQWIGASVLDCVRCDRTRHALQRVADVQSWVAGWPISTDQIGQQDVASAEAAAQSFWHGFEDIVILLTETALLSESAIAKADPLASLPSLAGPLLPSTQTLERGEPVFFIGSPYGVLAPNIFHNSVYSAIVSNVVTLKHPHHVIDAAEADNGVAADNMADLVMIDQECQPGCEGGPVFDSHGELFGMMLPPLRSTSSSSIEVHLMVPAAQFLFEVRAKVRKHFGFDESEIRATAHQQQQIVQMSNCVASEESSVVRRALESVVLVSVGSYWASGVIVSSWGHIITSAHLFKPILTGESINPLRPVLKTGYRIDIRLDRYQSPLAQRGNNNGSTKVGSLKSLWLAAELLFVSDSHIDVALLRLLSLPPSSFGESRPVPLLAPKPKSMMNEINRTNKLISAEDLVEPKKGDRVYVIGYSLFGPSKRLKATCTDGVVSALPKIKGRVQMIQTSCKVNKGASGGAVIDRRTGAFLGLVTCNSVTKTGVIISRINFSIPAQTLVPILQFSLQNRDMDSGQDAPLRTICDRDEDASAMWKITQTAEHLLPPYILEKQEQVLAELRRRGVHVTPATVCGLDKSDEPTLGSTPTVSLRCRL